MNLIELSNTINKPIELLKEEILDRFGIIVLSELNELQHGIIENYIGLQKQPIQKKELKPSSEEPIISSNEKNCLEELDDIQHPELAYTKKFLKYCLDNRYLIFIDTCSLLNEHFIDFYNLYVSQRGSASSYLFVPYVVIEELKRIVIDNKKEKAVVDKAIEVLRFIQDEEKKKNIIMVGNEDDKRANERGEKVIHADRVIIEKLIFFRNDSRSSLFITQDYDATVDALKQNDWHSSKSNAFILVKKIVKGGALVNNTKETVNPKLPIDK